MSNIEVHRYGVAGLNNTTEALYEMPILFRLVQQVLWLPLTKQL